VKPATLYAYVSRGLLRSRASPGQKKRVYDRVDVERLKERSAGHKGHAAVASGALAFGAPVIDSAITHITADVPRYRGRDPRSFVGVDVDAFVACVDVLVGSSAADGSVDDAVVVDAAVALAAQLRPRTIAAALDCVWTAWRLAGPAGVSTPTRERALARTMAVHACAAPGLLARRPRLRPDHTQPVRGLCVALGVDVDDRAAVDAIAATLVLLADHELTASTFAARVAASTGAGLAHCLGAGLATLSGPEHGAACDRVEALLDEVGSPKRATAVVQARVLRGEAIPGFGHRLYDAGDPRAAALLSLPLVARSGAAALGRAVTEAWVALGGAGPLTAPTVDLALVVVARALGLPPSTATGLFAIARTAGWLAHALEQRTQLPLLRPRARYIG
jgi:citrate synthase